MRAAAGLGEREMGARELEPDLDGQPGKAVVEQRPQTVRARQRRAGILLSRLVECDARRRHMRERARRVVAEAGLLDERLCRPRALPRLAPGSLLGREERELCLCEIDLLGGAGRQPCLDGRRQVVRRTIGCAEQRMRNASQQECGTDPITLRGELIQRQIGVGERLLDTVRHHVRPQGGDPGLDRGAAIRERDRRGCPVGESEPPLGIRRPARQRADPGSENGERGVPPQLVIAEPPQPLLQGLHPAVVVERQRKGVDQAGDRVRLTGRVPVDDRRLRQVVGDAPVHRTTVERGHHLRLAALELVAQQLAEQVVVAIPPPRRSSGTTKQFVRSSVSSVCAERVVSSTASHSPPDMRSSTEVYLRNCASAGGSRDRSSRRK